METSLIDVLAEIRTRRRRSDQLAGGDCHSFSRPLTVSNLAAQGTLDDPVTVNPDRNMKKGNCSYYFKRQAEFSSRRLPGC
jgi:hypothetical protein